MAELAIPTLMESISEVGEDQHKLVGSVMSVN